MTNNQSPQTVNPTNDQPKLAEGKQTWAKIIEITTTPLGFFALVILVLESLFVVLVLSGKVNEDIQSVLLIGTFVLILILIILVSYFEILKQKPKSHILIPTSKPDTEVISIEKGKILCASSPQWFKYDFDKDVDNIKKSFRNVTVENELDSEKLEDILTNNIFSILHIAGYVDRKNGDIIFSETLKGKPIGIVDRISSAGFSTLVKDANLVVLATCDSLLLSVHLSQFTNVISTNGWVEGKDIAKWSKSFYRLLSKGATLSEAYNDAIEITKVPMLLIIKKDFKLKQ